MKSLLRCFIFACLILGLFSCKKQDSAIQNTNSPFEFSKSIIDSIGTEHNRLLKETFDRIIITRADVNRLTTEGVNHNLLTQLNITFEANQYGTITDEEYQAIADRYSIENVDNSIRMTYDTISNSTQKYIIEEMTKVAQDSTLNLTQMLAQLDNLEILANQNLSSYDLAATLVALEVCRNSAELWFPLSAGGQGYYELFFHEEGNRISTEGWRSFWRSVGAVVCADAIGAFGGFVKASGAYLATGGPVNPASNAAIAGSTIIGAVTSSASSAIGQAVH